MRMFTALGLTFLAAGAVTAQPIAPDLEGEALIEHLRTHFSPSQTLDYRGARHEMFSDVDNENGGVVLVYTGEFFATTDIPNHNIVNTEHTWPQSKFGGGSQAGDMKTDLHHLYPTHNRVNGERGNKPFGDIPDAETEQWWRTNRAEFQIPQNNIDGYSESTDELIEPREEHKGNVARSMAYFYSTVGMLPEDAQRHARDLWEVTRTREAANHG